MAQLATKTGVEGEVSLKIHTPLLHMTKLDIIKKGLELGVEYPCFVFVYEKHGLSQLVFDLVCIYSITHSCYDPKGERPCEHCDSCILRQNVCFGVYICTLFF